MRFIKLTITLLFLLLFVVFSKVKSQNVQINVLTQNTGIVSKGKTVFLEVTINNTDHNSYVGLYKIKVQISVPNNIVSILRESHVLPTNWIITSNDNSTIILSNGKDIIASRDRRTILIAIKGDNVGGPSTISGNLSFSNGEAPGTEPGT